MLGAVELYAAGFLIVSGIELIASRAMDSRGIFTVGLSLSAGLTVMLMLTSNRAPRFAVFAGQQLVAGLLVVVPNMLFRLGTAQRSEQALDERSQRLPQDITDFVDRQGAAWGACRAVVQRAAQAALKGPKPLPLRAGRTLRAFGAALTNSILISSCCTAARRCSGAPGPGARVVARCLPEGDGSDGDAALDAALRQVSGVLLRHLADRVASTAGSGAAPPALCLHFDH